MYVYIFKTKMGRKIDLRNLLLLFVTIMVLEFRRFKQLISPFLEYVYVLTYFLAAWYKYQTQKLSKTISSFFERKLLFWNACLRIQTKISDFLTTLKKFCKQ